MIGKELRSLRIAAGFHRLKDFAEALDMTPQHMSMLENGHSPITRTVEFAARYVCQERETVESLLRKLGKEMGWTR